MRSRSLYLSEPQAKVLLKRLKGIGLTEEEGRMLARIRVNLDAMVEGFALERLGAAS